MTKFKKRKEEQLQQQGGGASTSTAPSNGSTSKATSSVSERFGKIFKKNKKKKALSSTRQKLAVENSPGSSDENSSPSSPMSNASDNDDLLPSPPSNGANDYEMPDALNNFNGNNGFNCENKFAKIQSARRYHRKAYRPLKNRNAVAPFMVDQEFWVQIKTCCGYAYENQTIGALLIDTNETREICQKHSHRTLNSTKMIAGKDDMYASRSHVNGIGASVITANTHDFQKMAVYNPLPLPLPLPMSKPTSLPSKKHHLLKSQGMLNQMVSHDILASQPTDLSLSSSASIIAQAQPTAIDLSMDSTSSSSKISTKAGHSKATNYLHKIKADSGKIVKQSLERMAPSKIKVNEVKNLIKYCTDKSSNNKKFGARNVAMAAMGTPGVSNENKVIEAIAGNKFSDNSSDSGYEETLHDTAQVNLNFSAEIV